MPLKQEKLRGVAFEALLYAEDTSNNFMHGAAKLKYLQEMTQLALRKAMRFHYDPLIDKYVVWGGDRTSAKNSDKV